MNTNAIQTNAIQRIGNVEKNYNITEIKKQLKNAISAEINKMSNKEVMNYVSSLKENEKEENVTEENVIEENVKEEIGGAKKQKRKSPVKKPKSKKSPKKKSPAKK